MSTDQSIAEFLSSLEKERAEHVGAIEERQRLVAELDGLIPGIRARIPKSAETAIRRVALNNKVTSNGHRIGGPYAGLSLRKALLKFLAQRGVGVAIKTSEIATELKASGVESKAEDFSSNCSATLSVMYSQRGEVARTEDGWALTDKGALEAAAITGLE